MTCLIATSMSLPESKNGATNSIMPRGGLTVGGRCTTAYTQCCLSVKPSPPASWPGALRGVSVAARQALDQCRQGKARQGVRSRRHNPVCPQSSRSCYAARLRLQHLSRICPACQRICTGQEAPVAGKTGDTMRNMMVECSWVEIGLLVIRTSYLPASVLCCRFGKYQRQHLLA